MGSWDAAGNVPKATQARTAGPESKAGHSLPSEALPEVEPTGNDGPTYSAALHGDNEPHQAAPGAAAVAPGHAGLADSPEAAAPAPGVNGRNTGMAAAAAVHASSAEVRDAAQAVGISGNNTDLAAAAVAEHASSAELREALQAAASVSGGDAHTERVVDLRSDTVTRPTPEMRRAMAEVGPASGSISFVLLACLQMAPKGCLSLNYMVFMRGEACKVCIELLASSRV